jgi:hypothetical protein
VNAIMYTFVHNPFVPVHQHTMHSAHTQEAKAKRELAKLKRKKKKSLDASLKHAKTNRLLSKHSDVSLLPGIAEEGAASLTHITLSLDEWVEDKPVAAEIVHRHTPTHRQTATAKEETIAPLKREATATTHQEPAEEPPEALPGRVEEALHSLVAADEASRRKSDMEKHALQVRVRSAVCVWTCKVR